LAPIRQISVTKLLRKLLLNNFDWCGFFFYYIPSILYRSNKSFNAYLTNKLYHIMLNRIVHLAWAGFKLTTLVVIGTDCTASQLPYDHDHEGPGDNGEVYFMQHYVNKTVCHDITEILLKVALNSITLTLIHILKNL
jgi:hypothetical protein